MTQRTCERCATPLPPDAQFCPACGWPVAALDGAGDERKLVSVLFADLADSTELAGRLDPERFREVMAAFYKAASDELASLRGRAEKFVGDAVMAVFGLPHAHDDDALRAVRAGLSIRDRVERLGERQGLEAPLRVRVGVNTGSVMASTAPAGEFLVSGPAVNLAARLQQAADPGEVLVGDTTWQLTRHAAEFGEVRVVQAKGFAGEVHACPVVSLTPRSSRRTIPLVGRRRELDLVASTAERAVETSRAHLVTLVGEPGIGKSRLVQELLAGLPEGTDVLSGRASEFGEDVTFAPLADLVRRRLGLSADAEPDVTRKTLHEAVGAPAAHPDQVERTVSQLGLLLGLEEEGREGTRYRGAEIRAGFLSFLEVLTGTAPVVVVLEDLHLARRALLEVIEEVLRGGRRLPLTVVAVGREDLLRKRPEWGAGLSDAIVLRLESLTLEESMELAAAAGGDTLEEATVRRVAEDAGGNPFFIVETTGMLLHQADRHTHETPRSEVMPLTVQAVVASRIDHLSEPARNLIRIASIFPGGAFHESKLAMVGEADPEILGTLEDEELIVRDEDVRGGWRFRHELLREVAYDSLAKRERRRLHEQVARELDDLEASEKNARQVAFHLEQAALSARDLDPSDSEPSRRGEAALRRAGDLARRRMESRPAVDLYERALALAGPEEGWGPQEARILAGIGEARYWLGQYEESEATLTKALEKANGDPWARTLAGRFLADITLNIHGEVDRAEETFLRAQEAAEELGDPWSLARTLLMAGWVGYWRGDYRAARRTFEEALRIARENPEGDRWGEARALISLGGVASSSGDPRSAYELADQALEVGREIGDAFTVATAQERRSSSLRAMWRLREALECSNEAVRIYRDLAARWELASALGDRGTQNRLLGRLEEAEADLRESYDICRDLGDRVLVEWTASELALVLVLRGRLDEARSVVDDPSLPETTEGPGDRTALLWSRSIIDLAAGDIEAARRHALEALDVDRRRGQDTSTAISVWWVASLFGPEAVGGPEEVDRARARLESVGWVRAFHEPDQILEALAPAR